MAKLLTTLMGVIIMAPSAYASGIVGMQEIGPDVCQRDYLGLGGEVVTSLIYCSTGEPYEEYNRRVPEYTDKYCSKYRCPFPTASPRF